jgi:hypothetical protein
MQQKQLVIHYWMGWRNIIRSKLQMKIKNNQPHKSTILLMSMLSTQNRLIKWMQHINPLPSVEKGVLKNLLLQRNRRRKKHQRSTLLNPRHRGEYKISGLLNLRQRVVQLLVLLMTKVVLRCNKKQPNYFK